MEPLSRLFIRTVFKTLLIAGLSLSFQGCNIQSGKNHYILAERLFGDQKYEAAVQEFRKVIDSDPKSALAQQALYRTATIEQLYLERFQDAVKAYRQFIFLSKSEQLIYESEKNVAEILFTKVEDYSAALDQYKRILDNYPKSSERDFFEFRVAKSYYGLLNFKRAIDVYRELIAHFPASEFTPEARYQIANTLYTNGDCDGAIRVFNEVLQYHPDSKQSVFAKFGIGNCYEEQEKYDQALAIYNEILDKHPSRSVVESKIERLKVKQSKRSYYSKKSR